MKKTLLLALAALLPLVANAQHQRMNAPKWLENSVIYQVYPSSYMDSDGNGIGDIPGVLSRLDYVESLGVGAIWFNPLFESGWIDGGYDILDYYKVDPRFGTNTDLVKLIDECHKRGIKVLLDLVPGHTSMDHPWFKQSMEADANQRYSDYFIWSDQLPDKKAEETLNAMLASENPLQDTRGKWMLADAPRAKYYMKNFYACQPSLNFGYANVDPNHPWEQGMDEPGPRAVMQELKNILAFWFSKGVDGFRVDMASSLVKNDPDKAGIKKLWAEVREWIDTNYPERILMAEWNDPKVAVPAGFDVDMDLNSMNAKNRRMYFARKHQANGGAYFTLNGCKASTHDLYGNAYPADKVVQDDPAEVLQMYFDNYLSAKERIKGIGHFATITGNHDHLRLNTGDRNTPQQLKVMMAWVMTMPMPILYYGDEIGMRSLVDLPNVEGANHNGKERAGARTPMQWDGSKNSGFSTCEPEKLYFPMCPEWTPATSYPMYLDWKKNGGKTIAAGEITVESQDQDTNSLLNWTRGLIALRKDTKAFWGYSDLKPILDPAHPYPLLYTRSDGDETYLVALNPTGRKVTVNMDKINDLKKGNLEPVMMAGKGSYKFGKKNDVLTLEATTAMILKIR